VATWDDHVVGVVTSSSVVKKPHVVLLQFLFDMAINGHSITTQTDFNVYLLMWGVLVVQNLA